MSRWLVLPLSFGLGAHADDWDRLNDTAFGSHPLLTSTFINGLLANFGNGKEQLCQLEENGTMRAMCILRPRNALLWESFVPAQGQIGSTMIPDAAWLATLWHSLPVSVAQIDLLCNDPDVGAVLHHLPKSHSNHAFTMKVDVAGTFDDYWAARSRHLQSNLRRYEKRLIADDVRWHFAHITAAEKMGTAIGRYAALEGAGWKGRRGSALASSAAQHKFYLDVMLGAADTGRASVHELWFGDQLAASRIVLRRDTMQVMLKTTYDERLASYAPGRLLLKEVLEQAFASGVHGRVEFYTDAAPDLLAWATGQRWVRHATLFRSALARHLIPTLRAFSPRPRLRPAEPSEGGLSAAVFSHPEQLPSDARKFMQQAEKRYIEFGFSWYRNLVDTVYPDHPTIRFYTLRRAEKVVAVLPIRAEKIRLGWRLHALSNFYTTLFEPLFEPGLKSRELGFLLKAIQRDFPASASFQLSPMDPDASAYQTLLDAFRLTGWLPFQYFAFGNWYHPIVASWQQYLAERNGAMRSTIKRMGKKFQTEGGRLEIVTNIGDMAIGIAAFEDVYAASWKKPEPFPDFMPGLIRTYAEHGFLRLGLAWLNGKPVAAQMWIVSHGRAEIYKVAYDEAFKHYAPGTLISAMLMEHVTEVDKVSEVDYLIGDDPYKKTWMSHRRERWGIIAYNTWSLRGIAGMLVESAGRTVKAWRRKLRPSDPPPAA